MTTDSTSPLDLQVEEAEAFDAPSWSDYLIGAVTGVAVGVLVGVAVAT